MSAAGDILGAVDAYYTRRLAEHGASARGVDWKDRESQELRFQQLMRLCEGDRDFSLVDYGCGYGGLYSWLCQRSWSFSYVGYDVSPAMLGEARRRCTGPAACELLQGSEIRGRADYAVASGIFNVRLGFETSDWERYVHETLDRLDAATGKGFAVNFLTCYSDPERRRSDLYYADPLALFDRCKRTYAPDVALLHDYGLWEFTLLVRKQASPPRALLDCARQGGSHERGVGPAG